MLDLTNIDAILLFGYILYIFKQYNVVVITTTTNNNIKKISIKFTLAHKITQDWSSDICFNVWTIVMMS